MKYVCPECKREGTLWENVMVPGWRSVDENLDPFHKASWDRDCDWHDAEPDGAYGCSECAWEGGRTDLLKVDSEGREIPEPNPNQLVIE